MRSEPAVTREMPLNAALKYNPHLWGPDELRAIFAVRQKELQELLEALRESAPDQVPQHLLITGHRGMGKTTLLRRLALSIADTPELAAKWLPLTFPEEQYTVRTLSEFWFNVLDALADALGREGATPAELIALDARIRRLTELEPSQREEAALEVMTGWINEHRRGLVLLIDSSDQLFSSLSGGETTAQGDASATTLWRLRTTLSHQPGLFWIGASYEALESQHLYHDTFHDFFALYELLPLTVDEMRAAMLSLARSFGAGKESGGESAEREMTRILDTRPARLNALRVLTGGNPRATVMLYELFATDGEDSGQSDLKILLDLMTPLYKARMEALSDLPRKLFAHLMENWHPMGIRELVEASGIPATTVSGQLSRMDAAGLLEKTVLAGGRKRAGYQASERLFNVWYLMRSGSRRVRQRLAWLVEFMRMWYSRDELESVAAERSKRHQRGELNDGDSLEYSRAVAAAMGEQGLALEWSILSAVHRESRRTHKAIAKLLPGFLEPDGSHAEFRDAANYLKRFAALDQKLAQCPYAVEEEVKAAWIAAVKGSLSLSLEGKEEVAKSATSLSQFQYKGLIDVLKNEEKEWSNQFNATAVAKVYAAVRSSDFFPDCPDPKLAFAQLEHCFRHDAEAYCFALEIFSNNQHDEWVEKCFRRAIELDGKDARPWEGLGNLLQYHLKRYDEAEAAYRHAIELDETYPSPWNGLGNLLNYRLKRYDEAESAYRRAIELNKAFAYPWDGLGDLLHRHYKRHDEAQKAYHRAIELDETFAYPWDGLGNLLHYHFKRYEEAETAYRRAIELDETFAYPWNGLGNLLHYHFKRYEEAESAYRRAIELDEKNAYTWNDLGNLFQDHLKHYAEAEAAYRRAVELDDKIAYPWNGLGNLFQNHLKCYDEAEAAYRHAIELDGNFASPWNGLGNLLQDHLKRYDEAEPAYHCAIERDGNFSSPWNGLGNLLHDHLKRYDEAEAAYRRAIELDDKDAYAWANLGRLQALRGNRSEAAVSYRNVLARLSGNEDLHLQMQAHLWLDNRDLAAQALETLAQTAGAGEALSFYRLREQCRECNAIGLGLNLAELMEASPWEAFLLPFSLALRAAADGKAPVGAAPEVLTLANEVLRELSPGSITKR